MIIKNLINSLNKYCPVRKIEDDDCTGFQFGDQTQTLTGVMVTLDCSERAIHEAHKNRCNLIITHHPLFWPNPEIGAKTWETKRKIALLNHYQISVHTMHTNFDDQYLKYMMIDKFSLKPLKQFSGRSFVVAELTSEMSAQDFLKWHNKIFNLKYCQHNFSDLTKKIKKFLIAPGAGGFTLDFCQTNQIDTVVTGELKWSEWVKSEDYQINVITAGHHHEEIFVHEINKQITKILSGSEIKIITKFYPKTQCFHD